MGIIAFAFQIPIYIFIKNLVKRDRPSDAIKEIKQIVNPPDKYSFPSGHCSSSMLLTLIINQYFPYLTMYFCVWMVIVFISRISLGLHYVSDILFGALLGFLSFYAAKQTINVFALNI